MKNQKDKQKGIALVIAMLFLAIIAIFVTTFLYMSQHETQFSSVEEKSEKAFYYANAGVHDATFKLGQNEDYGTTSDTSEYSTILNNISFDSGTYTVRLKNTVAVDKFAIIDSEGEYNNKKRRIELILKKDFVSNPNVTFKHAVFSDGNISLKGNIKISGDLYANGDLTKTGASGSLDGSVSSVGTLSVPDVTITGDTTEGAPKLPPICLNLNYYESVALNGGRDSDGDRIYSTGVVINNYDTLIDYLAYCATNNVPAGLIFYESTLELIDNIILEGTIVVRGDFTLQASTITHYRDDADGDGIGSPFTIAATGNIELKGNSESTDGVFYTEKNFTSSGNSGIGNGAIFAKGATINGGGNGMDSTGLNIQYDTSLSTFWQEGTGTEEMTTYSWKELSPY